MMNDEEALRQLRVRIKRAQVREFKDIPNQEEIVEIIIGWMDDLRDGKRIADLKPLWREYQCDDQFINFCPRCGKQLYE